MKFPVTIRFNAFMTLGENIRARRIHKGWSTHELAARVGTDQSNISRYENDSSVPRKETLDALALALDTDPATLQYGDFDRTSTPVDKRRIPILDYVQAGTWGWMSGDPAYRDENDYVNATWADLSCSESTYALIIRGESMLPDFKEGDIVTIDPSVHPSPGDFVVATNESQEEAVFKQYAEVGVDQHGNAIAELRSLNPLYPSWNHEKFPFQIRGTLVEMTRRYRRRA